MSIKIRNIKYTIHNKHVLIVIDMFNQPENSCSADLKTDHFGQLAHLGYLDHLLFRIIVSPDHGDYLVHLIWYY